MALRLYLFSLYMALIVSAGLILLLFLGVNPFQAPAWIIILFYLSIFLFVAAGLSIAGFYLKVWASNREVIFAHLIPTIRQSIFFAIIMVGFLLLEQLKVLNWWNAAMLIIAVGLIELFFRARKV